MQTFQKPLSDEEEAYYLKQMGQSDEALKQEARQILIIRNLRLVAHIAKKYQNAPEDQEDFISIGTIGLIKAIDTFDQEKGIRLATYAARCIDNELLMTMRSRKKSARDVSLYDPIGTDKEGNEINLLDITLSGQEDFTNTFLKTEDQKKIRQLVDAILPKREKQIIYLRYGLDGREEMTQREIGNMLGISRSYVSRIEKRALKMLRKAFL